MKNHLIKGLFGNSFFITNSTWLGITRNLPERNKKFLKWKGIGFFRKSLNPQMKFRWLELFQCIWKVCDKKKKEKKGEKGQNNRIGFFCRERFKLCTRLINRSDAGKNNCFNRLIYKILIDFFFSLDLLILFFMYFIFHEKKCAKYEKV